MNIFQGEGGIGGIVHGNEDWHRYILWGWDNFRRLRSKNISCEWVGYGGGVVCK